MAAQLADDVEIVIVGAGAAGIAAGRALAAAGIRYLAVEARDRLGGRAATRRDLGPHALDLGCAWLHSAGRNPWTAIARGLGLAVDESDPAWGSQAGGVGFPADELAAFQAALGRFFAAVEADDERVPDRPAAALLTPGDRWNPLIEAVNGYINGTTTAATSVRDFARYADTEENWRIREGFGAAVAGHGAGLAVALGTAVTAIDHSGPRVAVETARGTIRCDAVVVTLPTALIAAGTPRFHPALPDKQEAASGLPLGVADKVFLRLSRPEAVPEGHVYGRNDSAETGSYHLRVFGHPVVEGYFGAGLARDLEAAGPEAAFAFAADELAGLFGADIRRELGPIAATAWAADPYARGAYSIALPGRADERARLAAPVGDRLFFAGEATMRHDYSTAHGAYFSGERAAREAIAALARRRG